MIDFYVLFFFSSRRRHTRFDCDWSSDVCSSDLDSQGCSWCTIVTLAGGIVHQLQPWLSPVAVGDTFRLLPGCDHTTATCNATFQNLARFGGFPYIPPPEAAA